MNHESYESDSGRASLEEKAEFKQFERGMRDDFKPVGTLEEDLFQRIVHAHWSIRKLREREAQLMAQWSEEGIASANPKLHRALSRLTRYMEFFSAYTTEATNRLQLEQATRLVVNYLAPYMPEGIQMPPRAKVSAILEYLQQLESAADRGARRGRKGRTLLAPLPPLPPRAVLPKDNSPQVPDDWFDKVKGEKPS